MFEVPVLGRHKRFGSDNPGIRKIPGGDNGIAVCGPVQKRFTLFVILNRYATLKHNVPHPIFQLWQRKNKQVLEKKE
jgi:hypothetical protein